MTSGARRTCGAALLAACALACADASPEPGFVRLLPRGGPVTLAGDTRLGTGEEPRLLLRAELGPGEAPPMEARVPPRWAGETRLAVHATLWPSDAPEEDPNAPAGQAPPDARRRGSVARLERVGAAARVPLRGLPETPGDRPSTLQVMGLPLRPSPLRHEAEARVSRGAVLAFSYGLREESWLPGAAPVAFRVSVRGEGRPETELFLAQLDALDPRVRRWHDARIALDAWQGCVCTFRFEASWEGGPAALALPAFAEPRLVVPDAAPERPNVLLVSLDTLRAASLSAYGYPRQTSPFLDRLATEGTLFQRALAPSVTTGPSHMSLFTGLYPVRHGLVSGIEWKRDDVRTLATWLRASGYRTAAFTENGFLIRRKGFGEGFDRYVENRRQPGRPRDARVTFGQARAWLDENAARPFFLFVHTYEVHTPYEPREGFETLFAGDGLPGPPGRAERDAYDREIRYLDDALRALFEGLEAAGAADSTLVVITSDHGEEFGEHGSWQHGATVYEDALRVPLLWWAPGRIPAGVRVEGNVSLIDVAPTLFDLLELPSPAGLDGTSLRPLWQGDGPPAPRRLFAEARSPVRWRSPLAAEPFAPPLVAVVEGDRKFVVHRPAAGPREPTRAFDRVRDPEEREPRVLGADEARAVEAWVDAYLGGRTPARRPAHAPDIDPDTARQLRDLGYAP